MPQKRTLQRTQMLAIARAMAVLCAVRGMLSRAARTRRMHSHLLIGRLAQVSTGSTDDIAAGTTGAHSRRTGAYRGGLVLPAEHLGVVLFAHGSRRHSPRNNFVAEVLHARGVGTLLLELLTPGKSQEYRTRFDIPLPTQRLRAATCWLGQRRRGRRRAGPRHLGRGVVRRTPRPGQR